MKWWSTVAVALIVTIQTGWADDTPEPVKQVVERWRVAWNKTDADAMQPVYDQKSIFAMVLKNMPQRVKERFAVKAKFYGIIKAIKVTAYFPDAKRCLAVADFKTVKGFPILFELNAVGNGFLLKDDTFGIDPTEKRDDAAINAFATQWTAAINSGVWKNLRALLHSKSGLLMDILQSKQPEEKVSAQFMGFLKKLGPIKSHAIKGYKEKTSEYIVEFDYETEGKVMATIILKKDADGKLRCARMDIDSGDRALKDMDSWIPQ